MSAGFRNRDLGPIEHDPLFAFSECDDPACVWTHDKDTKARAIARSRRHAQATGHVVTIWMESWQLVTPPGWGERKA